MKNVLLYLLLSLVLFPSCQFFDSSKHHVLRHRVVYTFPSPQAPSDPVPVALPDSSYIAFILRQYDLVDVRSLDSSIQVSLRYADTTNFMGRDFYDGLHTAYLNCETALRLCEAQYYLKQSHPNLSLVVLDASRPQHIQQMMWDSLQGLATKKSFYLAPPEETSLHNYGAAVDVSIVDLESGELLDMGTRFDHFGVLSEPIYEQKFLKMGLLSEHAYQNRLLLRGCMQRAKLNPITSEWWHFSLCNKEEASKRFVLIK